MADLNKEVWLPELMEDFWMDSMFITEARDMSVWVDNHSINLAEAGADPDVLENNNVFPVPMGERADSPLKIDLKVYDTTTTLLRHAEQAELSYDKRKSVLDGHRRALRKGFVLRAAHEYAPTADGVFTPVMSTSGDVVAGKHRMLFENILDLEEAFDDAEIPEEDRVLVLTTAHRKDLRIQDMGMYKDMLKSGRLWSFKLHVVGKTYAPRFNATTGQKVTLGLAPAATDERASFAFSKNEVMRAEGEADMFEKSKDPDQRADMVAFQKRACFSSIRGKGMAAIYTGRAA